MKHNYLTQKVEFHNLSEGYVYDLLELLDGVRFFKTYCKSRGFYIVDNTYNGAEKGLHFIRWDTMLLYLEKLTALGMRWGKLRCTEKGYTFDRR